MILPPNQMKALVAATIAMLLAILVVSQFREGVATFRAYSATRSDNPILFWIAILIPTAFAAFMIGLAAYEILHS